MLPPGMPRWGKAHKDCVRKYYRHTIAVQGPTQEMPMCGFARATRPAR